MSKYEYTHVYIENVEEPEPGTELRLTRLAENGWQLVGARSLNGGRGWDMTYRRIQAKQEARHAEQT